jgi:hypothetical protein
MNKKIILAVVIVVVATAAVFIGFKLGSNNQPVSLDDLLYQDVKTDLIEKEEYSFKPLAGWKESRPPAGVNLMLVNTEEKTGDEALDRINFKSYLAVSYDTLNGRNETEYIDYLKEQIRQASANVNFLSENSQRINNNDAYVMEAEIAQGGANFKVLIAVIGDTGEGRWILSFNTGQITWENYRDEFYQTIDSFRLK